MKLCLHSQFSLSLHINILHYFSMSAWLGQHCNVTNLGGGELSLPFARLNCNLTSECTFREIRSLIRITDKSLDLILNKVHSIRLIFLRSFWISILLIQDLSLRTKNYTVNISSWGRGSRISVSLPDKFANASYCQPLSLKKAVINLINQSALVCRTCNLHWTFPPTKL